MSDAVAEQPGGDQRCRECDRVGVEHPGQVRERPPSERCIPTSATLTIQRSRFAMKVAAIATTTTLMTCACLPTRRSGSLMTCIESRACQNDATKFLYAT